MGAGEPMVVLKRDLEGLSSQEVADLYRGASAATPVAGDTGCEILLLHMREDETPNAECWV